MTRPRVRGWAIRVLPGVFYWTSHEARPTPARDRVVGMLIATDLGFALLTLAVCLGAYHRSWWWRAQEIALAALLWLLIHVWGHHRLRGLRRIDSGHHPAAGRSRPLS